MKICKNCKAILKEDSKFCEFCGSNEIEEQKEETKKASLKCIDCGKENDAESKFCQYCGSKNLIEIDDNIKKTICFDCKKELPKDSKFCQYCGSTNIGYEETKIENTNKVKVKSNKALIALIIVSTLLLLTSGYFIYSNMKLNNEIIAVKSENESLEKKNEQLNDTITSKNTEINRLKNNAYKYEDVLEYAKKANRYSDFYVEQTILYKPSNKTVYVYWGRSDEIWLVPSSGSINATWNNTWNGYYTSFNVTYTGSGVEYVKVYNKSESRVIYVLLVG